MFGIASLGIVLPESCLAGKAVCVGSNGNEKASSAAAATVAILTGLFRRNFEPYGDDGLDPSKLLFNLEIYAKANCKNVQETMCYENPTLINGSHPSKLLCDSLMEERKNFKKDWVK